MNQARYDQDPLDFSASQAASSRGGKSHAESTDDGMASIYSYSSARDVLQFVKEMNGRFFNTQNDTYALPSGA